jgi:hypothetical protein
MARGKFNKRGGGKRLDAQSEAEIELRNERLAAFEEDRTKRRADEAEAQAGGEAKVEGAEEDKSTGKGGKKKVVEEEKPPVPVTTEEDHKRNMKKLQFVRRRREEAEKRRKAEEETEVAIEAERVAQSAARIAAESDSDDDGKKKKKKGKVKEIPKLTKIDIKKMKPALLKEALKERSLEIQGNAKILTARLLEYEEAR